MLHGSTLAVFVGAAVALLLTPGPAVLYIVTRSVDRGRAAGLVSVAGICTGTMVHVVAATLGLSAVLVSSALAFSVVQYAGAVYLVGLGIQMLRGQEAAAPTEVEAGGLGRIFAQGAIVNVLNPHTALFFFAFLPQFVNPAAGRVPLQVLSLGILFVTLSATTDSAWALVAGTAGDWIKRHPQFARRQRYVTGGTMIALGAATAVTGSRHRVA